MFRSQCSAQQQSYQRGIWWASGSPRRRCAPCKCQDDGVVWTAQAQWLSSMRAEISAWRASTQVMCTSARFLGRSPLISRVTGSTRRLHALRLQRARKPPAKLVLHIELEPLNTSRQPETTTGPVRFASHRIRTARPVELPAHIYTWGSNVAPAPLRRGMHRSRETSSGSSSSISATDQSSHLEGPTT